MFHDYIVTTLVAATIIVIALINIIFLIIDCLEGENVPNSL